MNSITIYGDSILKGVRMEEHRYVVDREWEQRFARRSGWQIVNRARFGCTLAKGMAVIRHDMEKAAGGFAVLEFGGNDCDYDWAAVSADPDGTHTSKTPPEEFLPLYRQAIELVRRGGLTPIVLTLPPIHSEKYLSFLCRNGLSRENILRWMGDIERIARWQKDFSDMAAEAARQEGARLIDVRAAFPEEPELVAPLLSEDGIHPSRLGQWLIYRTLIEQASVMAAG